MTAKIYAEGGGRGEYIDSVFRQSWKAFFEAAGLRGRLASVVRGGSRNETFDKFKTAVASPNPGVIPLLLVDSEDAVDAGRTVWEHLRAHDRWKRPVGVNDDQAFLMVQVMETWFLADRPLLRHYFGAALRENQFRAWPDLESVPKATVLNSLQQATAGCARPYAKGKVSFELLARLDPRAVEASCPHASKLLDRLRNLP